MGGVLELIELEIPQRDPGVHRARRKPHGGLQRRPGLYTAALAALRAQLGLATAADLLEGEAGADNFLRHALARLAEHSTGRADAVDPRVAAELRALWQLVETQFRLTIGDLLESLDDDDDAPVIVVDGGE